MLIFFIFHMTNKIQFNYLVLLMLIFTFVHDKKLQYYIFSTALAYFFPIFLLLFCTFLTNVTENFIQITLDVVKISSTKLFHLKKILKKCLTLSSKIFLK